MKKVATVLAVATVTMAMDNFGDDNFMINPRDHKMPGPYKPLPHRDFRKPILDKVVAADEFGDDHFAVDNFGDDNFAVDDFGDDNFAVDDFGDDNFIVAIPRNPYADHYKPSRQNLFKIPKQRPEARGTLPSPRRTPVGIKPTKPIKKPIQEKTIAADEFADGEMWKRTDLPLHPVNQNKPRYKIIAHDKVEFDDEFFAADNFGDDNFAVDGFGDDEFMVGTGNPHIKLLKFDKKEHTKKPVEKVVAADEFGDDNFAVDDFGDDNFAVDLGDDYFAVDNFGDEEFMVGVANPHLKLYKYNKNVHPKPTKKTVAADEFADGEMWSRADLPLHPINRYRIKPIPWVKPQDKVIAADEFGDDHFAVDDFGDDNFAVDDFGDDNFAVDDFGDDNFAVDDFGDDNFAVDLGDDYFAVDDFGDENFAVEFGDDELVSIQPRFARHPPVKDSPAPSLRGGSLYQLDKLLREAH